MKLTDIDGRVWVALGIGVVVLALVFALVWNFWLAPMVFMEQRDSAQDGIESTYSWENAETNYEWFIQQKHDISAKEKQANNTKAQMDRMEQQYEGNLSEWPDDARDDYEDYRTQLIGQQNMHNQMVAKYNARSNMENRNLFKDQLPYSLEEKFWSGDLRGN